MIFKGTFWVKDSKPQSENQVLLPLPQKSDLVSSTGGAQSQLKENLVFSCQELG